jgi:hypothetical protein
VAVTAASGVVTYPDVTLTGTVGENYVLRFTADPVLPTNTVDANAISIGGAGSAVSLRMVTQPAGPATSGATLATQPAVEILDGSMNRVTTDNATEVTVQIFSGAGGTLGGTVTATAVNGVATFSKVTLSGLIATNYVLRFTAPTLTLVDANAVTVVAHGTAAALRVATPPAGPPTSGAALATQPVIEIIDGAGNVVTSNSTTQVTASIFSGASGTLGGTVAVTAASGVVTYPDVTLTGTVGENYVLRFTADPVLPTNTVDANAITVVAAGPPSTFTLMGPLNTTEGVASTDFTITVFDSAGTLSPVPQDTMFDLTSTSGTPTFTPASPATVVNGMSSITFTYTDDTVGNATVTATWTSGGADLGQKSHPIEIQAVGD